MDARAVILARQAQHHRVANRGMFDERGLDFGRIDVGAAAQDQVGPPIGQEQIAVVIEISQIAERHPPLAVESRIGADIVEARGGFGRSEEHTSELQSLMRISYAVFCLKKKKKKKRKEKKTIRKKIKNGKYK